MEKKGRHPPHGISAGSPPLRGRERFHGAIYKPYTYSEFGRRWEDLGEVSGIGPGTPQHRPAQMRGRD